MIGNIGFGGSSPNSTGTNPAAVNSPAGSLSGAMPAPQQAPGAPQRTIQPTPAPMHASGLPNQPPQGINPQLWSSVLQHLNQTNYTPARQQGAPGLLPQQQGATQMPARQQGTPWSPLPSTMPPSNNRGGFMGGF